MEESDNPNNISASTSRFKFLTEDEIRHKMDQSLAENSKKKAHWAYNLFKTWLDARQNNGLVNGLHVFKTLEEMTENDLNSQVKYFVFEVRKQNGDRYPSSTLKDIY